MPRFDGDAAGSFVLRLAESLQAEGSRVEIVAPGAAGVPATGTINGVSIHRVRYADDAAMTLAYDGTMVEQVRASWSAKWRLIAMMRAMRRATREQIANARARGDAFDVVHAHWWFPAGLALWRMLPSQSQGRAQPARVLTMHGSDVRLARSVSPSHALLRAVLAEQQISTAVSSWLASTVHGIAPASHVQVAPMPVDVERFQPDAHAPRDGILFVGRLNAQKGIADIVEALAQPALAAATLDVVGDGADRAALETRASTIGVAARIRWHGAQQGSALPRFYQRAQVLAMPSREEGLGLVAVEAQLCGTPVVAYDSGGVVDVVQPAAGGALVPTGNIAQLAEGLARNLTDPVAAVGRGEVARASMLERFSPHAAARQYLGFYEEARRA